MGEQSDLHRLEELIDELSRVIHGAEAREVARRAGFPETDLLAVDHPLMFWSQVVREAEHGKVHGGAGTIAEAARARFPGNPIFTLHARRSAQLGHPDESPPEISAGPVPRVIGKDVRERRRSSDVVDPSGVVDVVILTAALGEDTALLEVTDGILTGWDEIPAPKRYPSKVFAAELDSLAEPGRRIRVVTSRPPRMAGDNASHAAGQLIHAFDPEAIAMCGVCAGRPGWTELGDVVIGDRVWRYDSGARVNATKGGRPVFKKDTEIFQVGPRWLREIEDAAEAWMQWPGQDSTWLEHRPRTLELQGLWLLDQLDNGEDAANHPEVERFCPAWSDVTRELKEKGFVEDGAITEAGRKRVREAIFENRNRLPEPKPWRMHVGPIATGNHLVEDVDIWDQLEDDQRLVRALEMEIATIGGAGWIAEIPFLAAKGVMDFALPERHRGFRPFAARASAEVLVRLLRMLVTPRAVLQGQEPSSERAQGLPLSKGGGSQGVRAQASAERGEDEAVDRVPTSASGRPPRAREWKTAVPTLTRILSAGPETFVEALARALEVSAVTADEGRAGSVAEAIDRRGRGPDVAKALMEALDAAWKDVREHFPDDTDGASRVVYELVIEWLPRRYGDGAQVREIERLEPSVEGACSDLEVLSVHTMFTELLVAGADSRALGITVKDEIDEKTGERVWHFKARYSIPPPTALKAEMKPPEALADAIGDGVAQQIPNLFHESASPRARRELVREQLRDMRDNEEARYLVVETAQISEATLVALKTIYPPLRIVTPKEGLGGVHARVVSLLLRFLRRRHDAGRGNE